MNYQKTPLQKLTDNLVDNYIKYRFNGQYDFKPQNPLDYLVSYNTTIRPLDQETGDYLRKVTPYNPKLYSNDLRHQYASAVFAQKYGQNQAKILGALNELTDLPLSGIPDSKIDYFNNAVGREYAKLYPNYTKEQYLNKLFEDYHNNKQKRIKQLGF